MCLVMASNCVFDKGPLRTTEAAIVNTTYRSVTYFNEQTSSEGSELKFALDPWSRGLQSTHRDEAVEFEFELGSATWRPGA